MMKARLFACTFSLLTASCLEAQELRVVIPNSGDLINDVDQSTVAMHAATPFLESSSLLLADINLEKIDVAAIASWANDTLGLRTKESSEDTKTLEGFLTSLKSGGVSHVFITAATRSPVDGGPLVILPCQNPAVVQGLATVMIQQAPDASQQKVHAGERFVIAGASNAVDRVLAREGVERPDLILPLKGADLLDHTIVIALPAEARGELSAMWPETISAAPLPNPISPRQIARDVLRVVVSVRLPPEPEMIIRIETIDASAADRTKTLIDEAVTLAGDVKSLIDVKVNMANVDLRATPEAFFKIASTMIAPARANAKQMMKMNSMKQIGLALHNYHSTEKHFPPRVFTDAQGNALLSWRVAILPYIEQLAMYRAMKIDQPWNSPANQLASSTLIPTYCADEHLGNKTRFRAPVFPGSLWDGAGPPKAIRDVHDGLSNTIAVMESPESAAIEWANPEPWILSHDDPMSDVFGDRENVIALMLDGSVRVLSRKEMTNEKLRTLLTISGAEPIED